MEKDYLKAIDRYDGIIESQWVCDWKITPRYHFYRLFSLSWNIIHGWIHKLTYIHFLQLFVKLYSGVIERKYSSWSGW